MVTTSRSVAISAPTPTTLGMEALWLLAAGLIPLIFAPQDSMTLFNQIPKVTLLRTVVGLLVMLWLLEWGLNNHRSWSFIPSHYGWARFNAWVREEPTRWIVVAATIFLGVNILSTIFSASRHVSLWGSEPAGDGYSLYNVASYFLLFLVVVAHLKTRAQLWRLLWVITVTGVFIGVYGIFQYYNVDPFNQVEMGATRVPSTLGNPIFAAAVLVMTIPISLAMGLVASGRVGLLQKNLLWVAVLAVQFVMVLYTQSRGPWVGLAVGILVFLLLTWMAFGRRILGRSLALLLPVLAVTLIVTTVPFFSYRPSGEPGPSQAAASRAMTRAASIGEELTEGGLAGRLDIWRGAGELIVRRPSVSLLGFNFSFLRPVIGYGPEMFQYAFPLGSPEQLHVTMDKLPDFAHNHLVHEAVELGFLGITGYVGLLSAFFIVGLIHLRRRSEGYLASYRWILVALLAAVGGRVVEEMVGIARVADLTLFWLLLGVFVVLPTVMRSPTTHPQETELSRRAGMASSSARSPDARFFLRFSVAIVLIGLVATLTWVKNVNYVRADVLAASAVKALGRGDFPESLQYIDRSLDLAPDVPIYYRYRAFLYDFSAKETENSDLKLELAQEAYRTLKEGLEVNPLSLELRHSLADSSLRLVRLGESGKKQEAVALYQSVAMLLPKHWRPHNWLAVAYLDLGEPGNALKELQESLAITGDSAKSARALWIQGVAYRELGEAQKAVVSTEKSLELGLAHQDIVDAHFLLADVYTTLGDSVRAEKHLRIYEELHGK